MSGSWPRADAPLSSPATGFHTGRVVDARAFRVFFPIADWFMAFLLTLVVELPVGVILLRPAEPELVRRALAVLIANLVTHPAVWYVLTQLLLVGTLTFTLVAETWAVLGEAVVYGVTFPAMARSRALAVALVVNTLSFAIGRVVRDVGPSLVT
jgi:hypothetical protein